MCSTNCLQFGAENLSWDDIQGKKVVEIGAHDINGSFRNYIESLYPSEYVGVDITKGYGVDIICKAEDVRELFGDESYDIVVSTELLEHVRDWRKVISNLKHICKTQGVIMITTRSHGFDYHGWPYDFWRYELSDMERIFGDFIIEKLEKDDSEPGVLLKARKPCGFLENDLSDIDLYSMVENRRIKYLEDDKLQKFQQERSGKYLEKVPFRRKMRRCLRDMLWYMMRSKLGQFLLKNEL